MRGRTLETSDVLVQNRVSKGPKVQGTTQNSRSQKVPGDTRTPGSGVHVTNFEEWLPGSGPQP